MSEDEFARLIDRAVGALRCEAGEAFASPYAVAESVLTPEPPVGDCPSIGIFEPPEEAPAVFPEEAPAIDEFPDAGAIAARFVPVEPPEVRLPFEVEAVTPARRRSISGVGVALIAIALVASVVWRLVDFPAACRPSEPGRLDAATPAAAAALAASIVTAESGGDADAKNARSTATGAGQFLDGTWLDMIRVHRPDLAGRSEAAILELRHDADLSREMVARFAEGNAALLARRCLPVTPGTLYLAHFAGGAGASAVLAAPDEADAAGTIAAADARGTLTREKIVTANPFLARFTVADLKRWADGKMRLAGARL